jgi:nitrite reductase/ring-hydroxylating ferredoxin subunit
MTGPQEAGSARTTERRYACLASDLEPGSSLTLAWEPPVALHRTADGYFHATADACTHEKWSLSEDSDLEGNEVTCPLHMARFDVRTGEALCSPATVALRTYPVEVDGDKVYVAV